MAFGVQHRTIDADELVVQENRRAARGAASESQPARARRVAGHPGCRHEAMSIRKCADRALVSARLSEM